MEKWKKKEYENRRKQSFDFKNVGTFPFFPMTHRNLDLGMGKYGEKVYEKR